MNYKLLISANHFSKKYSVEDLAVYDILGER